MYIKVSSQIKYRLFLEEIDLYNRNIVGNNKLKFL